MKKTILIAFGLFLITGIASADPIGAADLEPLAPETSDSGGPASEPRTGTDSSTGSASSAASGQTWPTRFQQAYMRGCTRKGSYMNAYCGCALKVTMRAYTPDQFAVFSKLPAAERNAHKRAILAKCAHLVRRKTATTKTGTPWSSAMKQAYYKRCSRNGTRLQAYCRCAAEVSARMYSIEQAKNFPRFSREEKRRYVRALTSQCGHLAQGGKGGGTAWTQTQKRAFYNSCTNNGTRLVSYCKCALQETQRMYNRTQIMRFNTFTAAQKRQYQQMLLKRCGHLVRR